MKDSLLTYPPSHEIINSFLNIPILNENNLYLLLFKFGINLLFLFIIAHLIYFPLRKNRNYLFTLYIFNIIIFLVCFIFNNSALSLGFAFGVFAIFSLLRFRTISLPLKEMTYFFISISLGIINSLSAQTVSLVELIATNIIILTVTFFLEKVGVKNENAKLIVYEKIDLLKPQNHPLLINDLRERTGLDIHRFEIGAINFLRDTAEIKVFYNSMSDQSFENIDDNDSDD